MKVSSNNESVDLSHVSRSKKSDRAKATEKQRTADEASAPAFGGPASVDISSEAKMISKVRDVAKADDVNQEKVDRIKAMINGGTYKPDYGKVAEKMVNETVLQELS